MPRLVHLDALRALAVALVLGRHLRLCPDSASPVFHFITSAWECGGWIGVDLFFVLSGFLVSGLIFREHAKNSGFRAGRFLIRRGFKIYPPFWLLIGYTVVMRLRHPGGVPWAAIASELLFVQNYFPAFWNHTWSLAVEEHFYLLIAFAATVLVKLNPRRPFASIPFLFAIVAFGCLLLRLSNTGEFTNKTHMFPSHLRLDSLTFGVLLAHLFHTHPTTFRAFAQRFRYALLACGCLTLSSAFVFPPHAFAGFGFSALYLGSGCLLVASLGYTEEAPRPTKWLAWLGAHSYSIYLWHMAVESYAQRIQGSWFYYFTAYIVGSLLVGIVMSKVVEVPALWLRDRWFPSREQAPNHPSLHSPCALKS